MCLTSTPAVQTGFERGAAGSPATGLGGSKRRVGREDATAATAAGPRPCCTRSRQHPRQRPAAGAASGLRAPAPLHPVLLPSSPGVPCPQPPVSLSDTPLRRCSRVPLSRPRHRPLGRPPALRGASPKLLPPARSCCRADPGCTRTVAGTRTRTARTHTLTHPHTPPGARSPPRHAPPRAGRRSVPPRRRAGVQGPRGCVSAERRGGLDTVPGKATLRGQPPSWLRVRARRRAEPPEAGSRGQPRSPAAPGPSARPACPAGRPTAEPRGPLGESPLRRTWPGEAVAPCLLGAGIGGSPAAPSWRAGGGATAVGWARVPSVFSTAPPQGKKTGHPGLIHYLIQKVQSFSPPP